MGFTIQFDMSQFVEKNIDKSNITSLEMCLTLKEQEGNNLISGEKVYVTNKLRNYNFTQDDKPLEPKITVEEFFSNSDPNSYGYET